MGSGIGLPGQPKTPFYTLPKCKIFKIICGLNVLEVCTFGIRSYKKSETAVVSVRNFLLTKFNRNQPLKVKLGSTHDAGNVLS